MDVLSGTEEARLSFLGAVEAGPESGLLIDLGGGSTELVRYEGREILSSCSLSLGSLSLFSRNVSALHPTGKERKAIRAQVKEQLERHVPDPPAVRPRLRRGRHRPGRLQGGQPALRPAPGLPGAHRPGAAGSCSSG